MAIKETSHGGWSAARSRPRTTELLAGALLAAMAAIHLLVYFGFQLTFGYPGALFVINAVAAVLIGAGVLGGLRPAWHLAALFAAGTIAAFFVVHTVGLPGFYLPDWVEMVGPLPLGPLSLAVEAALLLTYAWSFSSRPSSAHPARTA